MWMNLSTKVQNAAFTVRGMLSTAATTTAAPKESEVSPFMEIVKPIIKLINGALLPSILLVTALGAIYCVILGAKFAKAEEPQDQQKAKQALKNAILGFILIFVLLSALRVGSVQMAKWYGINL